MAKRKMAELDEMTARLAHMTRCAQCAVGRSFSAKLDCGTALAARGTLLAVR